MSSKYLHGASLKKKRFQLCVKKGKINKKSKAQALQIADIGYLFKRDGNWGVFNERFDIRIQPNYRSIEKIGEQLYKFTQQDGKHTKDAHAHNTNHDLR